MLRKFKTVLTLLPPYRVAIAIGFGSLVLTNLCQAVVPRLVGDAIDTLKGGEMSLGTVDRLCLLIFVLAVLRAVFQFTMRLYLIGTSRQVEYRLRDRLFAHLQTLSFSTFNRIKTGDLMSRATADVEAVRMVVGPGSMYISNTLVVVPAALFMMLSMSVPLTILSMIPLLLVSVLMRLYAPKLHGFSLRVQDLLSSITTRAQESMAGARVIKAFAQEPREEEAFSGLSDDYLRANVDLARMRGITTTSIWILADLGTLILLWVGGGQIIRGNLTLGEFVAFNSYHLMLLWPMIAMGWVIALYQRGVAAMGRIDDILETRAEIRDDGETAQVSSILGELELRNVTFSYTEGGPSALSEISLHVPAGKTVAIVGPTGSGKSTLVQLVPRLFEAPPGSVFVDGIDIRKIPLATLRSAIGYVPQDGFLFSDTVRENIALGLETATDDAIVAAAEAACVADQIRSLPHGFDQLIGERGVTLSGGQKQRVAIARAVLRKPKILILDDCLSAVDTETEARLLGELRRIREGRTTLVVSHRISTIQDADIILVVREGRIVERGRHDELLAHNGLYRTLFRMQRLERDLEEIQ